MKKLFTFASVFLSTSILAAPVSPIEGFYTTNHTEYELEQFWDEISSINRKMEGDDCFKRASIWSYKLDRKYGVKSKKVFMHYTDKFNHELDDQGRSGVGAFFGRIFSSNDGWDFHVAPAVEVNGVDYVIDPHLVSSPRTTESWVEYLTERGERLLKKRQYDLLDDLKKYRSQLRRASRSRASRYQAKIVEAQNTLKRLGLTEDPNQKVDIKCQKITHIMEFDRAQQDAWCFYQETSMYYHGPLELRFLNYGSISSWDQRRPVTDLQYHTEDYFSAGRNYVQTDWDYDKLDDSLDEYKVNSRPKTIHGI
ncbi:MAG: hypothetical protein CME64_06365 [Halobacteriovoraceae bacterium]|nr:hypothetical protein [Halobacteriovoraceae bacterium]|tara:strand:+ start:74873 stop:75799 length:927 start_codon:yes stop_codon:yes gene_type:complete